VTPKQANKPVTPKQANKPPTPRPINKPPTPRPVNNPLAIEKLKRQNYVNNFQNLLKKPNENKQQISYNVVNYLNYNTVNSLLKTVPYPFETATPNEIIDNINFQYKLQSFL
jgi:hypothetical protein